MRLAVWHGRCPKPAFKRCVIVRPLAVKAEERGIDLSLASERLHPQHALHFTSGKEKVCIHKRKKMLRRRLAETEFT
jgi:hypothetical protein